MVEVLDIVVLGRKGVGKTAFTHQLITGEFLNNYESSGNFKESEFKLHTNACEIKYNLYEIDFAVMETLNQEKPTGVLLMYDVSSLASFEYAKNILPLLGYAHSDIPVVVVGNKVDLSNRQVAINAHLTLNHPLMYHHEMSVRTHDRFVDGILWLTRKLLADPNLEIVQEPAAMPPLVRINQQQLSEIQEELQLAAQVPLPNDHQLLN